MKKNYLLSLALPMLLLPLFSCSEEAGEKTWLDRGRLYEDGAKSHYEEIDDLELATKVNNKDSFILVAYDDTSTCECWAIFRSTINKFMEARNAAVYLIDKEDLGSGNAYGITIYSDTETVAIFSDGVVSQQRWRNGTEDSWANDEDIFIEWMDGLVEYSPLLQVSEAQLETLYGGEIEFTIFFGRETCGDCTYVNENFLETYQTENDLADFYYFDLDPYRNNESTAATEEYQAFKDKYGLSESGNATFGYSTGVVPTFLHVNPAGEISPAEAIDDAAVYLNDSISHESGVYSVSSSYYTETRLESLEFLKNSEVATKVLEGLEVNAEDVIEYDGNYYWTNSAAAAYHTPILKAFLDTYVKNA